MMSSRKRLHILFDANSLMVSRTGVGHYVARMVEQIAVNYPDEVELVGYYYNFLGRKRAPASPSAPNISYRPVLFAPGPLVNLLRRFGVEIPIELLTFSRADFVWYPNYLTHPSIFRTPCAPVVHDVVYHDFPEYGADKSVRDLTRFVPHSLKRASFVVTVSEFSKQRICDTYGVAPDKVLTTFIPLNLPEPLPDNRRQKILSDNGITKPYLFFIGTMEPRKNIPNLLEAYTLLPDDTRQDHTLVLAGKIDWKYQETKQKLEDLQAQGYDIIYLGYVDDETRAALYQGSKLFVLPSNYEGFGMQVVESLTYGIPCAASDIPVFHEVGGSAIAYFDHKNPAAIAKVIAKCLRKPADPSVLKSYAASLPTWREVSSSLVDRIKQELQSRRS